MTNCAHCDALTSNPEAICFPCLRAGHTDTFPCEVCSREAMRKAVRLSKVELEDA